MIVYKDFSTGDELISDSFKLVEVSDCMFEVTCKMVTVGGEQVDIGANPSQEEDGDAGDFGEEKEQVIDVVAAFRLQETGYDKGTFKAYIKGYLKKVKGFLEETNPDRVKPFMKSASGYIKEILTNFKEYQFFTGESCDPDAHLCLLRYKEDGMTPYLYFWKDGMKAEKV